MKRQASLALALCLTAIVGFAVVAYGSQLGFFKSSSADGQEDTGAALIAIATYAASFAATPTQAQASEPMIVDEYVYEDVFVQAPASSARGGANEAQGVEPVATVPRPLEGGTGSAPVAPIEGSHDDDASHDDDIDDEHDVDDGHDADDGHESESEHEEGHLEKEDLKGTVTAVSGSRITITGSRLGNAAISVTSETAYRSEGESSFSFDRIRVGMYLDTKVFVGEGNSPTGPGGTWVADKVTRQSE